MVHIKVSAGKGNRHIAIVLLLAAAFFLAAAASSPHTTATTVPAHQSSSVLKMPTEAARATGIYAVKDSGETCCDECGICTRSIPPICTCRDVHKECPSWCKSCEDVEGGKMCADFRVNYCKNGCGTRKDLCCNRCGACSFGATPVCNCMDVVEECPFWCDKCVNVVGIGKMCMDFKPNYCENTCGTS